MLYHVVAMAENQVIGKNNRLPWHFSSDLKYFKQLTIGQTVLMGRKTFESIGKPLPGRENFVLSKSKGKEWVVAPSLREGVADEAIPKSGSPRRPFGTPRDDAKFFYSIENAIKAVRTEKCFIIGGSSLYKQTIPRVDGIYMTQIHAHYEGDAFYPEIPPYFKEKSREKLQENPKIEVIFYENSKKK